MNDQDLCQLLEQLQSEINATDFVDEKERELLLDLEEDICELLERCEAETIKTHPLTIRRLEDAGIRTPLALAGMSVEDMRKLGVEKRYAKQLHEYMRRRLQ